MIAYTESIWDYDTSGLRKVMFWGGRLHLARESDARGYLGFTVCGPMIPADSLIDDEIHPRLRPTPCKRCEAWLERAS